MHYQNFHFGSNARFFNQRCSGISNFNHKIDFKCQNNSEFTAIHIFPQSIHINLAVFQLISPPSMAHRLVDKKLSTKFDYKVGKSVILWESMLFNVLNT